MKFFNFDIEGYDFDKYFFKTFYINIESIDDIIIESHTVILRTRSGGVFYLKKEDSDRLLKLINDLNEKEAKK